MYNHNSIKVAELQEMLLSIRARIEECDRLRKVLYLNKTNQSPINKATNTTIEEDIIHIYSNICDLCKNKKFI